MNFQIVLILVGMAFLVTSQPPPPDDCERSCGNVSIPFPFGLEERCYYSSDFLVACNRSSVDGPRLTLGDSTINIRHINTSTSEIEVTARVAYDCYNTSGRVDRRIPRHSYSSFWISNKNRFVAIGCDTNAYITGIGGNEEEFGSGCISTCNSDSDITNGSCSGVGCCEITVPNGLRLSRITLDSFNNHSDILEMNPCSYAFIVEEGKYDFSSTDLLNFTGTTRNRMPRLLDWAIGKNTCASVNRESDNFLCKGNYTECDQEYAGPGYRCRCKQGYSGNPYIENNCTNIDECQAGTHNCNGECIDSAGSYRCPCPNGQPGENRKDNNTCTAKESRIIQISVGTSVAGLFLILLFTWIYLGYKRRKSLILREKYFEQNGGMILKEKLSGDEGPRIKAEHFTVDELKKATKNYHESRIIGKGGFGTVYKGVLPDKREVAIKMSSKIVNQIQTIQVKQFINEVSILSQVNHKNVVKLIGCCLETVVPSLVYEFIPNGTLSDHIHDESKSKAITWDIRLKVATETAGALSYLLNAVEDQIIHRDVKPTNILLDYNFVAKVADFGASRLIPMDQNEVATKVQGTRGYMDPEYSQTGQLTEKSDVYSFGVVLVELLTGKKIVNQQEKQTLVTKSFEDSLKNESLLLEVLDKTFQLKEVPHDIILVSRLAQRCLHLKGEERPTMKEVAFELEQISAASKTDKHPSMKSTMKEVASEPERISAASKTDKHPSMKRTSNEAETKCLLNGAIEDSEDGYYSMMPTPASSETV